MGIFWCNISYKTLIDPEPLHIGFNKIDGFTTIYDGNRYLTLFGSEKYDAINNRIRYLTNLKYLINLKLALHIFFLTILQRPKLILLILCSQKKWWLCIML